MLFLLHVRLQKPADLSNQDFYGVWLKEAEAATAALRSGAVKALYKVPGKNEVVAILDVDSAATMDRALHSMPIWRLGYAHLVQEVQWTPLRPYEEWAEDLKKLAQAT